MRVVLNGEDRLMADGATVESALAVLDLGRVGTEFRGVAVAVDAEVVPRGEWATHELSDGAHVEVLRAIQGG